MKTTFRISVLCFLTYIVVFQIFTNSCKKEDNNIPLNTVTDIDGNVYNTVTIGTQVWMQQNLKVMHYNNGVLIPVIEDSLTWLNLTSGGRCYYKNDPSQYEQEYGALYNGYAAIDANHICPAGWHVPTNDDWQVAENFLGGVEIAGGKMKEAGTIHWKSPNTGATNGSLFCGLPGGDRHLEGDYLFMGENGLFWTSSNYNNDAIWSTYLYYLNTMVDHNPAPKNAGFSIRCVKDF